jgi:hypothetical protein
MEELLHSEAALDNRIVWRGEEEEDLTRTSRNRWVCFLVRLSRGVGVEAIWWNQGNLIRPLVFQVPMQTNKRKSRESEQGNDRERCRRIKVCDCEESEV